MTPNLHFLVLQDINLKGEIVDMSNLQHLYWCTAMNLCWLLCWDMYTRHAYSTRPLS